MASWTAHTHLIDLVHDSPYVLLLGPPETGKTRVLEACTHTARRGILTPTTREAALIRFAELYRATIALDLIDFMKSARDSLDFFAVRSKRDGTLIPRVIDFRRGFDGIQYFSPYGATIIASNTDITHEVIASRTTSASRQVPPSS